NALLAACLPQGRKTNRVTSPKQPMSAQQLAQPTPRVRCSLAAHARRPAPFSSAAGWLVWVTWACSLFLATVAGPLAGFRCGGSEMTEPGASLEDPWVKASSAGEHAGEGRRGGRVYVGGPEDERGHSGAQSTPASALRARGSREDSSPPARAKVEYAYSDNSLDPGLFVESSRKGSVVSRANSIGSTSASSVPNTDDEDSDYHQESYKESYKDRRRRAHTQAEQKRRDAIKRGYDDLQTIVPTCQQQDFSIGSQKLSKAIVLQKTIDYIQFLHKEKKKQEEEVSTLRKDVMALKIMKVNYEQIVKAHQDNPHEGEDQVSDQVKFNVFQGIMDSLFQSFNASISMASFQELSACVFSWIEEHCKPQSAPGQVSQIALCPHLSIISLALLPSTDPTGDRDWCPAPTEEPALLTCRIANKRSQVSYLVTTTGLVRSDCDTVHQSAGFSFMFHPLASLVLSGAGVFVKASD
ncbi:hypothetical protein QTO34_009121, partial [Cnephaeus nilssonii]